MTSLRTVFLVQQSSSSRRGIRPTGGRVRYGPTKGKYYTVLLRGCALIVSKIVEASRSGANRGQHQDSRASGRREGPSPVSFTSDTFSSQKEASRKRAACVRRLGIASRVLRRAGGTRPRDICVTGQRVLVSSAQLGLHCVLFQTIIITRRRRATSARARASEYKETGCK